MKEGKGDVGHQGDKDWLAEPPIHGQQEILHVFVECGALDIGLVELRDAKALVHDDAIADNGAQIGDCIPMPQRRAATEQCHAQEIAQSS